MERSIAHIVPSDLALQDLPVDQEVPSSQRARIIDSIARVSALLAEVRGPRLPSTRVTNRRLADVVGSAGVKIAIRAFSRRPIPDGHNRRSWRANDTVTSCRSLSSPVPKALPP
ncbi:MAG: hypothetical protein QOJ66_1835 [Ilumatobacteraceae bacterium]